MTPKVYILASLRHAADGFRQVARRTHMKNVLKNQSAR